MITPKLVYSKRQLKKPKKGTPNYHRYCAYCQNDIIEEYFEVVTPNEKILKLFEILKLRGGFLVICLCPECFEKLHPILEEIEEEGYEVLDPDSEEFTDLDEDQGTGSGS